MSQVTKYNGISKVYFKKILFEIIKIGSLKNINKNILDYGCGEKYLEKMLEKKILNYDIDYRYNEIKDIYKTNFDIVIFNHVLMYLKKDEIQNIFNRFYKKNKNCEFIIGIGKQNFLSIILKNITFNFKAHEGTISSYNDQLQIIKKNMEILKYKKNIFFMTDIFHVKFK